MAVKDIDEFYKNFAQRIILQAEVEEEGNMRESAFTALMIDYLQDSGEAEDGILCNHFNKRFGTKINAYYINDEGSNVDIFVSIFKADKALVTVTKTDAETALDRATRFINRSFNNSYYTDIEEAHNEYDIAHFLYHYKDQVENIRVVLLTNGVVKPFGVTDTEIDGIPVSYQIWDIERLFRLLSSGKKREEIEIDLEEIAGVNIPCIMTEIPAGEYNACFASIPGEVLVAIYEKYGSRLLERNVRTFLQLRGKVNKGIKQTLETEPEMFLAYNNGISATAASVEFVEASGEIRHIKKIKDLQIVNGGQTTASLYYASKKKKGIKAVDLSNVYVQAKISIIQDAVRMDEIVLNISRYANSQNRIQMADFSANKPFHRKIEEWSRTVWAPAKGGGDHQTKWFYERMRGQYDDSRNMASSAKLFMAEYDPRQKFDKTDLAKFENCWDMYPHVVSKGKQDCFNHFANRQPKDAMPDQRYFEHLIAKAIIFQHIYQEVTKQFSATYRANIIAYAFSYIAYRTANRIDMDAIWKTQAVMHSLALDIEVLVPNINNYIRSSAGDRNVTQWCKQEDCWTDLKNKDLALPHKKEYVISDSDEYSPVSEQSSISTSTKDDNKAIEIASAVTAEMWISIAEWGKETNTLETWQNGIAKSIGQRLLLKKQPSVKQARQAVVILQKAIYHGFDIPNVVQQMIAMISHDNDDE